MIASPTPFLQRGRAAIEALMQDTCRVKRLSSSVTDQDTGQVVNLYDVVYEGKCRFQSIGVAITDNTSNHDVGDSFLYYGKALLQLPMSVAGINNEDIVVALTSPLNIDLPGRVFTIHGFENRTHATTRRYHLQEVQD